MIETLDRRKGLEPNFLWPPVEISESEAELEDKEEDGEKSEPEDKEATWENQPVKDKLVTALSYLRNHYFYCLYCGTQVCSPILHERVECQLNKLCPFEQD